MKHLSILLITILALWALAIPGAAKSRLPVTVSCTKTSDSEATVKVKLRGLSASSLIISVGGTGSVTMDRLVRHYPSTPDGREISLPLTFTSGLEAGGLVVEVKGDFGNGVQSQIQTFDLVDGNDTSTDSTRPRAHDPKETAPNFIIVPSRTTTEAP